MRTLPAIRDRESCRRPRRLSAIAGVCLLLAFAAAAQAPAYEQPPTLSADRLLPPELLRGPHYHVAEVVTSDGYLNTYVIESDYGPFTARGDDLLRERVKEVAALAALSEVTKSDAFTQAAAAAAKKPVEMAANVIDHPVETVKGIPSGVNRLFKRTSRQVKKVAKKADEVLDEQKEKPAAGEAPPNEESTAPEAGEEGSSLDKTKQVAGDVTKRYLGVGRSMREWAQKLGVDPYTTNETLRAELGRVAGAGSVGSFGVRMVTPSLGPLDDLGDVNNLVWTMNGTDLEVLNLKRLKGMGLGKDESEAFLVHPAYSPSRLTSLVAALEGVAGVPGRDALVRLAAAADSEEGAFFFQRSAEMLRAYHGEVAPVRRILAGDVWGGGLTAGGTLVMTVALDNLAWTEDAAAAFGAAAATYRGQAGVERLELWLAGRASARARQELEKLGFKVEEKARERWLGA